MKIGATIIAGNVELNSNEEWLNLLVWLKVILQVKNSAVIAARKSIIALVAKEHNKELKHEKCTCFAL